MKKLLLASVIGTSLLLSTPAFAATSPQLEVMGQAVPLKNSLHLVNNRTMIALQDLVLIVHGKTGKAENLPTLTVGNTVFAFQPHANQIKVNAAWKPVDQGATVDKNGNVFVPLAWMVKQLGHTVSWDAKTSTVNVGWPDNAQPFTPVAEASLTAEEKAFIEQVKYQQGIHQKDNLYVIANGKSPNTGYGLQITKQEMSWEQARVYVKLTKPKPGNAYAQVITYPYLAGKVNLPPYTTVTFIDADTGKPLFGETSGKPTEAENK
jgi:hypothetical protein